MNARTFAHWQAAYAEHGIPLMPMEIVGTRKKPMVTHPDRLTLKRSRGLATEPRFKDVEMFGFIAGARSKVTILDIDGNDDRQWQRLLQDMQDRHGESRLIARTPSGGFHLYYRHNGEQAKVARVRPWRETGEPIDVLHSGPVVAPPSQGTRATYEIICGTLDDLAWLTVMRGLGANDNAAQATRIRQGERAEALWRFSMSQARFLDDGDEAGLLDVATTWANNHLDRGNGHQFTDAEIKRTVHSAWELTRSGRNWFGGGQVVPLGHAEIDEMAENPDAFTLYMILKRLHWGRNFAIANAMAATMPGGGWTVKRFAAARRFLEERRKVVMLRPPIKGAGPAEYCWLK